MDKTLTAFERDLDLPPRTVAAMLGCAYVTYMHYRNQSRVLPPYHERHLKTLRMLNRTQMRQLLAEVGHG